MCDADSMPTCTDLALECLMYTDRVSITLFGICIAIAQLTALYNAHYDHAGFATGRWYILVHHCLCARSHGKLGRASVYCLSMRFFVLCLEMCITNTRQ